MLGYFSVIITPAGAFPNTSFLLFFYFFRNFFLNNFQKIKQINNFWLKLTNESESKNEYICPFIIEIFFIIPLNRLWQVIMIFAVVGIFDLDKNNTFF